MPDGIERPDERADHKQDIDGGQEIVSETKLNGSENEVEKQIERKRQGHHPGNLPGQRFIKYRTERDGDNRIQHRPDRPKEPARWRPCWFDQLRVPVVSGHGVTPPS